MKTYEERKDYFKSHRASAEYKEKARAYYHATLKEKFVERYKQNKEKINKEHKAYYKDNKLSAYRRHLKNTYGITVEQFEAMAEAQSYKCAICGTGEPGGKGRWHVDHDHATDAIRGLLCHYCNVALGCVGDDVVTLQNMINYLAGHRDA